MVVGQSDPIRMTHITAGSAEYVQSLFTEDPATDLLHQPEGIFIHPGDLLIQKNTVFRALSLIHVHRISPSFGSIDPVG
jgi:hypothetical protein